MKHVYIFFAVTALFSTSVRCMTQHRNGALIDLIQTAATSSNTSFLLAETLENEMLNRSHHHKATKRLTADNVFFIIQSSTSALERLEALRDHSWLEWAKHYVILSDKAVDGHNLHVRDTTPEDRKIAEPFIAQRHEKYNEAYILASLRQLRAAKHYGTVEGALPDTVKYVAFLDDDTFVNVPALLNFLSKFWHEMPLAFGHVWVDNTVPAPWSFLSGAAMFFTKNALQRVTRVLFTESCPTVSFLNDVMLSTCSRKVGVAMVHSSGFNPEKKYSGYQINALSGEATPPSADRAFFHIFDAGAELTLHRAHTKTIMAAHTCLVSHRYMLHHPACVHAQHVCSPICFPKNLTATEPM